MIMLWDVLFIKQKAFSEASYSFSEASYMSTNFKEKKWKEKSKTDQIVKRGQFRYFRNRNNLLMIILFQQHLHYHTLYNSMQQLRSWSRSRDFCAFSYSNLSFCNELFNLSHVKKLKSFFFVWKKRKRKVFHAIICYKEIKQTNIFAEKKYWLKGTLVISVMQLFCKYEVGNCLISIYIKVL